MQCAVEPPLPLHNILLERPVCRWESGSRTGRVVLWVVGKKARLDLMHPVGVDPGSVLGMALSSLVPDEKGVPSLHHK